MFWSTLAAVGLVVSAVAVTAQSTADKCYTTDSIVGAVLFTIVVVIGLLGLAYILWRYYWKSRRGKHLVLVTDPEKGGDYAFDNLGFREGTPVGRSEEKEDHKLKWQNWTPVGGVKTHGKPKALDDSYIGQPLVNIVPLRSHDFTGLGFNICGNMRDGIFVKDVLHRGPASESGRIVPGDRIESIRISFRHMVFEDALTILSYASPYEVQLEVENGSSSRPATLLRNKRTSISPADRICHPFFRSQSISDLSKISKSGSTKWIGDHQSMRTSDIVHQNTSDPSKPAVIETSPIEKLHKFGVRVLPTTDPIVRTIEAEKHQNVCNSIIESTHQITPPSRTKSSTPTKINDNSFDEIDLSESRHNDNTIQSYEQADGSRKETPSPGFKESNVKAILVKGIQNLKEKLQHAGLKPDKLSDDELHSKRNDQEAEMKHNEISVHNENQIFIHNERQIEKTIMPELVPFDIPEEVQKAGLAARSNRKSIVEIEKLERKRKDSCSGDSSNDGEETPVKKGKRKAPLPPQNVSKMDNETDTKKERTEAEEERIDSLSEKNHSLDSADTDSEGGDKSGTTIELNASHITVHHAPDTDSNRKAASLGDLSRLDTEQPIVVLERAVSLDLADGTPGGSKKRKAPLPPQGEEYPDDVGLPFCKEARIDNSAKTRLKKWGRLEDVVKCSDGLSDDDTDAGISGCSTPERMKDSLVCSTPLNTEFFAPTVVQTDDLLNSPPSQNKDVNNLTGLGMNSVHVSSCSWDLRLSDSSAEPFVTAVNGNSSVQDDDDTPPELPTSPIPTYVTEIQVVTSADKTSVTDTELEKGISRDSYKNDNRLPDEVLGIGSFTPAGNASNAVHSSFTDVNTMHSSFTDINPGLFNIMAKSSDIVITGAQQPLSSSPLSQQSTISVTDTLSNEISISQPNSLDPSLNQELLPNSIRSGTLVFSNENMSDEQILAMKSSPEPVMLDNGQNKMQIVKPDRTRNNISVTSIKAGGSRIPVRAVQEPSSQRKPKRESFVSFSSLNMSSSNDKRQPNGANENSVTHIVLDSQK